MQSWVFWLAMAAVVAAAPAALSAEPSGSVLTAPGRIEAAGGVTPLGSAVSGVVAAVHVGEGDRVRAGQLLVSIDCRVLEAEVKVREQELATATAILTRTKNGYRVEEIAMAAAAVKGAEANAEEAQTARQRAVALKVDNTATQARIDVAERDARFTAASLDEARQRLALVRAGSRVEDIDEATARRNAAAALLEQTRVHVDQCSIRAPADATVLAMQVTPGQFVSDLNQVPLVRLVGDGKRRVRTEVDSADLAKLCVGQRAIIKTGPAGTSSPGTLSQLGAEAETGTLTDPLGQTHRSILNVIVSADAADSGWPIGLPVTVEFSVCEPSKQPAN